MGMTAGSAILAICVAFLFLSALTIAARCWVRVVMLRNSGIEDAFAILALAGAIIFTALVGFESQTGLGQKSQFMSEDESKQFFILFRASMVVYGFAIVFVKVSILFQYLRFFPEGKYKRIAWLLMGLIVAFGLATNLMAIFGCRSLSILWGKGKSTGSSINPAELDANLAGGETNPVSQKSHRLPGCVDQKPLLYVVAAWNILTDIVLCVLPLPLVRPMTFPEQRRGLFWVFGLGGIACIASILRFPPLIAAVESKDRAYYDSLLEMWTSIEVNVGLMCACIPALQPLVRLVVQDVQRRYAHNPHHSIMLLSQQSPTNQNINTKPKGTPTTTSDAVISVKVNHQETVEA